jgi:hypothetical protein
MVDLPKGWIAWTWIVLGWLSVAIIIAVWIYFHEKP